MINYKIFKHNFFDIIFLLRLPRLRNRNFHKKWSFFPGDNLFNDNRSCVVHVLDSLYRAESQLPRFSIVIENCVLELATKCVVLTTQGMEILKRKHQASSISHTKKKMRAKSKHNYTLKLAGKIFTSSKSLFCKVS